MYGVGARARGALGERRPEAIVATKVWASTVSEGAAQIDRALGFFRGYVDLYQVHNLLAWRERLELLERRRDEGRPGARCRTTARRHSKLARVMRTGRITAIQIRTTHSSARLRRRSSRSRRSWTWAWW